jgi:hypothetical protein
MEVPGESFPSIATCAVGSNFPIEPQNNKNKKTNPQIFSHMILIQTKLWINPVLKNIKKLHLKLVYSKRGRK